MSATVLHATASTSVRRDSFYLALALSMSGTAYFGFWFTYFSPLFARQYPDVSPLVHVHGWSFFIWYLLLPVQAGLIRLRRVATHRLIGLGSLVLGAIMVIVGLIVSAVQVDLARQPAGNPFWQLMAFPIFSIWVLFTFFYVGAMYRRGDRFEHRQFILLASAVALAAATFRILVQIWPFTPSTAIAGCLVPVLFVWIAMIHEYRRRGSFSRIYAVGSAAIIATIGGAFVLSLRPGLGIIESSVAWLGNLISPLYLQP